MRDWLRLRADATPTATALAAAGDVDAGCTYADLDDRVEATAGRLAGLGVGVDDALAVCAGTREEFVTLVHATQRLGAVLVPLEAKATAGELATRLDRVEPAVVVCEADTEARVHDAVAAVDGDLAPAVASVDDPTAGAEALADLPPEPFDLPEWAADDPFVVAFTSGTTGEPKGVVLTLANVLASATAVGLRLGVRAEDCWHVALPMYHVGGLAPVYRAVVYGTALSVQRGFDPTATLAALRAADATAVSLVPTMLERLLEAGEVPALRFALVGGASCPPDLLRRAHAADVPAAPSWGMTETGSAVAIARPGEPLEDPASAGNPVMFAEVRVVDDGSVCEPGTTGELVVDGPMVTPGYLDEAATAEAFGPLGLHTGDAGYRDEAGRVYVTGRRDDRIVTGGETVDPAEVETALRAHPAVAACAVVGLPDDEWGERVAALVVADPSVAREDLRDHCADRLADYKRPRTLAFAAELPRTASGTVDRDAVRAAVEAAPGDAVGDGE